MACQPANGLLTFAFTAAEQAVGIGLAHEALAGCVVHALGKAKAVAAVGVNRPAGQDAGQFAHIGLGVAPAHPQRVQLHQLAGVVFIQAPGAAVGTSAAVSHALELVQVVQHGGVARAGQQQVFKLAQRMGAGHVNHIVPCKRAHRAFAGVHVEVVEPELSHPCEQGVFFTGLAVGAQAPCGSL